MTDATNRKLDVDSTDEDGIARDDPLFELSQIIGYSEPRAAAPARPAPVEDAQQIDLEDALLRELDGFSAVPEEDAAVVDAPAAEEEYPAVVDDHADAGEAAYAEPVFEEPAYQEPAYEEPVYEEPAAEMPAREDAVYASVRDEDQAAYAPAAESIAYEEPVYEEPEYAAEAYAEPPAIEEEPQPVAEAPQTMAEKADTLEAELMDLLGGLGDKAGADWEAPEAAAAAEPAPAAAAPQVPAEAPTWFETEEPAAEPELAQDDDSEILDAFESALTEGLALSFEEPAAAEEADFEGEDDDAFSRELEADLEAAYVSDIEAATEEIVAQAAPAPESPPVLDTAEMPSADLEAMQPLDLPELPEVEETQSAAVDIERELDAALSGYDQYDSGRSEPEQPMAAAASAAAVADTRLNFDMDAFEDDLARDLEFVDHDLAARDDGDFAEEAGTAAAASSGVRSQKSKRGMMIAAVVGGVAILGAIGAFGLVARDSGETGAPVLVKADPDPVKVVPEDPGGKEVPNQDRAVYGEVDGNGETAPTQETLVSTSEEPIDLGIATPVLPSGVMETAKVEDRLSPDATAQGVATSAASDTTSLLAPRRVRTVIVKPDGTLVANPPAPEAPVMAAAPTEPSTPVATAQPAPTQPAADVPVRTVETVAAPALPSTPTASETPAAEAATEEQLAALAGSQTAAPADTATDQPVVVRQPLRTPSAIPERPADQPVTIVGSQQPATQQVAAAPAAPQPQATAPSAAPVSSQQVPPGTYTVQVASQPSAELAQQSAAALSAKFANAIGGRSVTIQQAEIEGRGTYHRVRIVANGRQDAVALCERIKAEGGSCFVAR